MTYIIFVVNSKFVFVNALNQTLGFFVGKSEFNKAIFIHSFIHDRPPPPAEDTKETSGIEFHHTALETHLHISLGESPETMPRPQFGLRGSAINPLQWEQFGATFGKEKVCISTSGPQWWRQLTLDQSTKTWFLPLISLRPNVIQILGHAGGMVLFPHQLGLSSLQQSAIRPNPHIPSNQPPTSSLFGLLPWLLLPLTLQCYYQTLADSAALLQCSKWPEAI